MSAAISSGRLWDEDVVRLMMRTLTPGSTTLVLDLGSHVGQFSLLAAALGHKVVAVDAYREHVDMLERASWLNGFDVQVYHMALAASRGGPVQLDVSDTNKGGSKIRSLLHAVATSTIDDLISHAYPQLPVSFMKMDIEGYEPYALQGAQRLFAERPPSVLAIEITPREWRAHGFEVASVLSSLTSRGYTMYHRNKAVPSEALAAWANAHAHLNTVDVYFVYT